MPTIRLYLPSDLADGAEATLDAPQAHYLKTVMRQSPGDALAVFNGRDGEWRATVERLDRKSGTVRIAERLRGQSTEPDLWLLFAPVKGGRTEAVVEKAAELGVARIQPVTTRRSVVDKVNLERLTARAIEAAEQCGRLSVPALRDIAPLDRTLASWPAGRRLMLCDETGGGAPIGQALEPKDRTGPWAVLVGPEGGFASDELDAITKLPIVTRVGLGPRILRADTAAVAALACWQALSGDWRG